MPAPPLPPTSRALGNELTSNDGVHKTKVNENSDYKDISNEVYSAPEFHYDELTGLVSDQHNEKEPFGLPLDIVEGTLEDEINEVSDKIIDFDGTQTVLSESGVLYHFV